MDKEIIQNEDIALLRENFFKSMPILKEKFLSDLVAGRIKKGELWEKVGKYGIKISGNSFIVSIVGINQEWKCIEDKDCDTNKLFFNDQDRELMKFAVLNISEEIIGRFGNNVAFLQNDDVVIIYSAESKDDNLMEKAGAASEEIRQSIEKYLKFSVTIGIGNECENIENISSSYRQSINALDYRVVLGNNRIICIEDLEPRSQYNLNFDELKERLLVSSIKAGNPADLKNVIQELFGEIIDGKAAYKEYQVYLLEMLTSVLKTAKNLNVDIDNIFGSNNNLFTKMYNFNDIDKAKEWFVEVCHKIMGQISQNRQDTYKLLAKQAVEYINNYYFDDEISIDKICSILHVSPTYFSMIFKKETKMTFVTYLTKVRMEAAKGLLKTTNMKTFEIAEKVGYSEPNYFSYCFKKNFGISPSEYRSGA